MCSDIQKAMRIDPDGDDAVLATVICHYWARSVHVLIYDKEPNDNYMVLLVYIGDRGRVLRYSRLDGSGGLFSAGGVLFTRQDNERDMWIEAVSGLSNLGRVLGEK